MAVEGEGDDILTYTKKWFNQVNRGGLFPINDNTFSFFVEVEKCVHAVLLSVCYVVSQIKLPSGDQCLMLLSTMRISSFTGLYSHKTLKSQKILKLCWQKLYTFEWQSPHAAVNDIRQAFPMRDLKPSVQRTYLVTMFGWDKAYSSSSRAPFCFLSFLTKESRVFNSSIMDGGVQEEYQKDNSKVHWSA